MKCEYCKVLNIESKCDSSRTKATPNPVCLPDLGMLCNENPPADAYDWNIFMPEIRQLMILDGYLI